MFATCDNRGNCYVIDFLMGVGPALQPQAEHIRVLWKKMAWEGKRRFPYPVCHSIDDKEEIWELLTHKLRVLFFLDGENTFVFTNGLLKKRMKIRAQDKEKTINLKKRYFEEKESGELEYLTSLEE